MSKTISHTTQVERILVVDDEQAITDLLARYLSKHGYQVDCASDGTEMFACIRQNLPNLVLLDLELPGTHGLTLVKDLREKLENVGIIIVSGTGIEVDMVVALEMGADDYVQKPFEQRPLLARIRSVLRRVGHQAPDKEDHHIAHFSGYSLDLTAHKLVDQSNREVTFTGHEYQLLEALVRNASRVMSRDQIMDVINDRGHVSSDRSVDVLVSKIRKKLEVNPAKPEIIKTIRGYGYILTTRVEFSNG